MKFLIAIIICIWYLLFLFSITEKKKLVVINFLEKQLSKEYNMLSREKQFTYCKLSQLPKIFFLISIFS